MTRRTCRRTCLAFAAAALWNGALVALDVHVAAPLLIVIAAVLLTAASIWMCGFFAYAWRDAPPERRIVPLVPVERARQAEYDG